MHSLQFNNVVSAPRVAPALCYSGQWSKSRKFRNGG